jgi:hypothetical protein
MEHLPSMCKDLHLIPSTVLKKKGDSGLNQIVVSEMVKTVQI